MQAIKHFAEVGVLIEDLVQAIVFASPHHVIYETKTKTLAEVCVARLSDTGFSNAYTITKDGRWFVSVPL